MNQVKTYIGPKKRPKSGGVPFSLKLPNQTIKNRLNTLIYNALY